MTQLYRDAPRSERSERSEVSDRTFGLTEWPAAKIISMGKRASVPRNKGAGVRVKDRLAILNKMFTSGPRLINIENWLARQPDNGGPFSGKEPHHLHFLLI